MVKCDSVLKRRLVRDEPKRERPGGPPRVDHRGPAGSARPRISGNLVGPKATFTSFSSVSPSSVKTSLTVWTKVLSRWQIRAVKASSAVQALTSVDGPEKTG